MTEHVKGKKRSGDNIELPKKKIKHSDNDNKSLNSIKININGDEKILKNLEVTGEHVENCVNAILKLAEINAKKNSLIADDEKIFLQINCIKIPRVPQRCIRIHLPNTMAGPHDDVALIVPDIVKGRRQDYEKTIDHWETKLQQSGVTRIKDIIPINKIKTEYNQYEMQRKLARLYDFFLIDGRIAGHMHHILGKAFKSLAMPPIPIKPGRKNLKDEIETGLKKGCLQIHGKGNSHSVQVAASFMTKSMIIENVIAACDEIKKYYPGGCDNIRSMLIKTRKSLAIPIYYSLKNKNKVEVPIVEPKRPKAFKIVEGELSTIPANVKVQVAPSGHVKIIKKIKKKNVDNGKTVETKNSTDIVNVKAENHTKTKVETVKNIKKLNDKKDNNKGNMKNVKIGMKNVKKEKVNVMGSKVMNLNKAVKITSQVPNNKMIDDNVKVKPIKHTNRIKVEGKNEKIKIVKSNEKKNMKIKNALIKVKQEKNIKSK